MKSSQLSPAQGVQPKLSMTLVDSEYLNIAIPNKEPLYALKFGGIHQDTFLHLDLHVTQYVIMEFVLLDTSKLAAYNLLALKTLSLLEFKLDSQPVTDLDIAPCDYPR